jgi:hypothetical protein
MWIVRNDRLGMPSDVNGRLPAAGVNVLRLFRHCAWQFVSGSACPKPLYVRKFLHFAMEDRVGPADAHAPQIGR